MGSKITISELAIKVRLNSKDATKGLKRLETQLRTFQHYVKKSLNVERMKTAALHAQVNARGKNIRLQKRDNRESQKGLRIAKQTAGYLRSMKNVMFASIVGRGLGQIKELFKDITTSGMGVNMATMSLQAAVAASSPAEGLSKGAVTAMSDRQRKFALKTAATYGSNVAGGTAQYAKFFAAASGNLGEQGTMDMFTSLSKLGVVYGLTGEKMERSMTAFTQMASKNQVMAEELKQQLGDVLPGSMEIFARAATKMGKFGLVTVKDLYKLMEDGALVAGEIFPFVAQEMTRMAEANGALGKALQETSKKWDIFKSHTDLFKTTALNQYSQTLGTILDRLTKVFGGKGMASAVGQFIDHALMSFSTRFDGLIKLVEEFEQKFDAALTPEDKLKTIDDFFSADSGVIQELKNIVKTIFVDIGTWFAESLNKLSVDDFTGLIETLSAVFKKVFDVMYKNMAPSFFKDAIKAAFGIQTHDEKVQDWKDQSDGWLENLDRESADDQTARFRSILFGSNSTKQPINVTLKVETSVDGTSESAINAANEINNNSIAAALSSLPLTNANIA